MKANRLRNLLLLTIIFFTCISSLQAQPEYEWARSFGNSGNFNHPTGVAVDASGNTYICGNFNGTGDFDPGPATINLNAVGSIDIFIAKFQPNGNILWVKSIGSSNSESAYDLTLDQSGNLIICGVYRGTVDFDPGPSTFNLTTVSTLNEAFVLKLDSDGNFIWAKNFVSSGTTSYSVANALKVTNSGDIVVHGHFENNVDFDPGAGTSTFSAGASADGYIVKLNSIGDLVYAKQLICNVSFTSDDLVIDSNNDIIITGQYATSMDADPDFGTTTLTSAGVNDVYLIKFSDSGNLIWAKSFGGTGADYGNGIATDSDDNLIVSGYFNGTVDFDPGAGTTSYTSFGGTDIFLSKFDANGNFIWCNRFGGMGSDAGFGVSTDAQGNIYSTGNFSSICDFDPGAGVNNLTAPGSGTDMYLLKTNSSGTVSWVNSHGAITAVSSESGYKMKLDPSGNIYTVGTFQNTVDFDPGVGVSDFTSTGINNAFIQKLSQCDNDVTPPVANSISLADVTSQCSVTSLTSPTATDNCSGTITGTHNASLPITTQGTTIITWTYDDGNGNTSTQNQNVIIDDSTSPVANSVSLTDVISECYVTSLTAPSATDNCAGTIIGTHNASLPITTQGTTIITWTYDDGNGNTTTQNQNVIISPIDNGVTQVDAVTLTADASGYTYQWIDCDLGNSPISGAISQTFVAIDNGNYAVVINNGTCVVTSDCILINSVSLDENFLEIKVYPNPTTDKITVSSDIVPDKIEVYNAQFELISLTTLCNSQTAIVLPDVSGIYFVRITFQNTVVNHNIVKK